MAKVAADMTKPFRGAIYWQKESSYKNGFDTASGVTYLVSEVVENVRIDSGEVNQTYRTISEPSVSFATAMVDYSLHIEWVLMPKRGSVATYCTNRSCGDLDSLAFEIYANYDADCSTTTFSRYKLFGCKCRTITISAEKGGNYKCSADFSVASLSACSSTPGDAGCHQWVESGQEPTLPAGAVMAGFNLAGAITWTPTQLGGYVTNGFSITVDNNIQDHYTVGSYDKQAAIPGGIDVTGTMDISMEYGGEENWRQVIAGTDVTSVVLNTGQTGANNTDGKITLDSGRIDSSSINIETGGEGMVQSVPFTFKDITWAVGT